MNEVRATGLTIEHELSLRHRSMWWWVERESRDEGKVGKMAFRASPRHPLHLRVAAPMG